MKVKSIFILRMWAILAVAFLFLLSPISGQQNLLADDSIRPIVDPDWLQNHLGSEKLVVVDIRSSGDYEAGHIPGSINIPFEVPFSAWITMRNDLLLELPDQGELFGMLGSYGITKHSRVVVVTVGPTDPPYPLANATRVADTLIYAGVKNVTILDGGYANWAGQGRPTTTEVPQINPVSYDGNVKEKMFVSIDHVKERIEQNKAIIIDARDADVYHGLVVEPWADKPGHIPTAKSLPTPLIWNGDGTYKSKDELKDMAREVVGKDKGQEIIVYCGVGGYASSWWYVLTQVLGYEKVRIYDGAAQEWARYYDMVVD